MRIFRDPSLSSYHQKVRDYREDWPLTVTQPVAGNYYPATGGSSIADEEIKLMLHIGVGKPLDESVRVKDTCEGLTGLYSRRHCIPGNYHISVDELGTGAHRR